jgi:DNA repair photolyase
LDRAINPYRGCAHSCAYCYAQDVLRFEPGREWGQVVEVKTNLVQQLEKELEKGPKGVYGIGTVTDPYQPLEREHGLTRGCLEVLRRREACASILTKSDLVLRDLDILRGWTRAEVGISIGCADDTISAVLEPCAPPPTVRFHALKTLVEAGVSTYLMAAPIVGGVSDDLPMLASLVDKAALSGVTRIMWDKYNPKPMASARLRRVLDGSALRGRAKSSPPDWPRTRASLASLASERGLHIVDAF